MLQYGINEGNTQILLCSLGHAESHEKGDSKLLMWVVLDSKGTLDTRHNISLKFVGGSPERVLYLLRKLRNIVTQAYLLCCKPANCKLILWDLAAGFQRVLLVLQKAAIRLVT